MLWLIGFTCGFFQIVRMLLRVVRRKSRTGQCSQCGYDLRGSVSSACPECGRLRDEQRATATTLVGQRVVVWLHRNRRPAAVCLSASFVLAWMWIVAGPYMGDPQTSSGATGGLYGVLGFPNPYTVLLDVHAAYWCWAAAAAIAGACGAKWVIGTAGASLNGAETTITGKDFRLRFVTGLTVMILITSSIAGMLGSAWYFHLVRGPKFSQVPYLMWWPVPIVVLLGVLFVTGWLLAPVLWRSYDGYGRASELTWVAMLGSVLCAVFAAGTIAGDTAMLGSLYPEPPWTLLGGYTALHLAVYALLWCGAVLLMLARHWRRYEDSRDLEFDKKHRGSANRRY